MSGNLKSVNLLLYHYCLVVDRVKATYPNFRGKIAVAKTHSVRGKGQALDFYDFSWKTVLQSNYSSYVLLQ